MADYRDRKRSSEKDRKAVEELILDYACKNYMDDVVTAIVDRRGNSSFKENDVPHLRLVAGTLHSIVQREDVAEFDHALLLLDVIHNAAPELISPKQLVRLTTGIKTKAMLHRLLQAKFDYSSVCAQLNKYFPKAELKTTGVSKEENKLNKYQLRYRRLITRLMLSASEREAYRRNEMDSELGPAYTAAIQRLLRHYVDQLNEQLSIPVIEQIVSEGCHSQLAHDMMDSQSDCMDKLLSISFRGPPTEDQLLTLLKECWEEEEETETEDQMETSDGDDDDDWQSKSDIFDFPEPPKEHYETSNSPFILSGPQGHLSHPQETRGWATQGDRCHSNLDEELVKDEKLTKEAKPLGSGRHSSGQESPQLSCQADSSSTKQRASSGAKTVSKSRIYLSKSGLQNRSSWKRVQCGNVDSCVGPTGMESSRLCEAINSYKACIKRSTAQAQTGQEISESQGSASSDGSQSSSGKSSTSVSLLAGLYRFNPTPKLPRSNSPLMRILQDDEITGWTSSSLFEDTFISDIQVYPVTRLGHSVDVEGVPSTSRRNSELSEIQETPQHGEAASQLLDQDNTVSSSSTGQLQPTEVRVKEVEGHKEIPETEKRSCDASDSRHTEPEANIDEESAGSLIQDVGISAPKRACSKKAVVKLKRLSQDSKVRRYLKRNTLSRGSPSVDDASQSSDSEDSIVPDSDDEDSASTSDSSSLPCIKLRPDPECQVVRHFPSLREYLQESTEDSRVTKDHRMRECTVRLRRLKPTEIDALTNGKGNIKL